MKARAEKEDTSAPSTRLQMLQTLDTLRRERKIGERLATFLQRALQDIELPLTQAQCERLFRAFCRHEDGSDYSKSQRAVFVSELNRVLGEWHQEGLTIELLQVRNYRRERQYGLLNVEALQYVTLSQPNALKEQFLCELNVDHGLIDRTCLLEAPFHHFVFAAIGFGGMAWNGVFTDLARLQWKHLRTAAQGYLLIPRFGTEQRIYVPPIVAASALLVGTHLPRPRNSHEPDSDQPILPGLALKQWRRMNSEGEDIENREMALDDDEAPVVAAARAKLNAWLGKLCQRAGLRNAKGQVFKISVQALAAVARAYVIKTYTPTVAGALLGLIPYSPVVERQRQIFEEYRQVNSGGQLREQNQTPKPFTLSAVIAHPVIEETDDDSGELVLALSRLHDAVRRLFGDGGHARKKAAQQLDGLADSLLTECGFEGETAASKLHSGFSAHLGQDGGTDRQVAHFNIACIALWLANLCRNSKLDVKTIAARRSDALMIMRSFPTRCVNELDAEDGYELAGSDRAPSSRRRLIGSWHQLHSFLGKELNLPVEAVDWREFAVARTQSQVTLLGQSGFDKLQGALLEHAAAAQREGETDKAGDYRNAYFAANLAFCFGARLNETVQLTISDLVLRSQQPYMCIWRSKRGKSRIVYARHIPDGVLAELKKQRDRRHALTKDLAAPLLAGQNGESADPKRISQVVIETLDELGLRGGEDALPVVFHTLRHEYANRLMVLGVPLLDIANSMGHASPDTTAGSYVHCFDFLQREQLEAHLRGTCYEIGLSYKALGGQLGIGRTAVLAFVGRYEKAAGEAISTILLGETQSNSRSAARADQRVIPYYEVVRLLAFRLGLRLHRDKLE